MAANGWNVKLLTCSLRRREMCGDLCEDNRPECCEKSENMSVGAHWLMQLSPRVTSWVWRGGTPSKARAKTPTHRLLTPPFETENIPVYTPPTDQQSTNLPGGQLNSRAGTVKEKKCARGRLSSNQRLEQMGQILAFKPVETEPDIWLKTKIKSETGGRGRFQMLNQPPPVYSYC